MGINTILALLTGGAIGFLITLTGVSGGALLMPILTCLQYGCIRCYWNS
ncbi:hypothetical protein MNB_ARC-1_836 [hydrothermal vent metagenome]|uniref:Uncharacterized protein n=1 Tax=hydrothermal vent metagenome TaxID=652676 RepID=A0A3B1EA14_9ZZZZ